MNEAGLLITSYFLGALPFSYAIVKMATGEDVRDHFSGNAGATNAGRVLKKFMGEERKTVASFLHKFVFALDVLKGTVAVYLMSRFGASVEYLPIVAGLCAVIGHTFSIFLKFKGGKGVATCLGILVGLFPAVAGITFGAWALCAVITRYVSLSSVVAGIALHAVIYFYLGSDYYSQNPVTSVILGLLSLLIVLKHKSNLKRIAEGTEPKIGEKVS